MTKSVKLYFLTDKKNLVTISIANAEDSLKDHDVSKAMDEIISSNVYLNEKKGTLETKYKAALVTKTTVQYDIK